MSDIDRDQTSIMVPCARPRSYTPLCQSPDRQARVVWRQIDNLDELVFSHNESMSSLSHYLEV